MIRFIIPCLILITGAHCAASNVNSGYVYSQDAGVWLRLHLETATWYEAGMRCTIEGGVLASPTTSTLAQKMVSMMAEQDQQMAYAVFTGINSVSHRGDFTSLDGVPLSSIPVSWAPGQPDNVDLDEDCVLLTSAGKLADISCQSKLPYFCRKDNAQMCGTQAKGFAWEPRTGSCYKFHRIAKTWNDARSTCQAESGHLAVINSDVESTVLKEIFAKNPSNTIIGTDSLAGAEDFALLGFEWNGEEWVTINGKTLTEAGFATWKKGEPNRAVQVLHHHRGSEQCGSFYRDGGLNDIGCKRKFAFICELTPILKTIDDTPAQTQDTNTKVHFGTKTQN